MGRTWQAVKKIIDTVDADPDTYKDGGNWKSVDDIVTLLTASIEAPDSTRRTDRDFLREMGFVDVNALMVKFKKYAEAHEGFAIAFRAMQDYSETGGIDVTDPEVTLALNFLKNAANMPALGLVAGDELTQAEVDAINAVGKKTTTRAEVAGIPERHLRENVTRARDTEEPF